MKNKTAASVLAHLCSSRTNEKHGKLSKTIIKVGINGTVCDGLIDTGATVCFIDAALANRLKLKRHRGPITSVTLADKNCKICTKGEVRVNLENCITDVIIGLKTLELHESVTINFQ